jgi:hypothetical protein
MAKWRLDGLTRLEKFAEDNQLSVTDLMTQMLYLIWELEHVPLFRAIAAMKVLKLRSKRVAMRRQSL